MIGIGRALLPVAGLGLALGAPAGAVVSADAGAIAASAYVRARAAEALGELDTSAAGYATALAVAPGDPLLATRSYRQALAAGDQALAVKAARVLEAADKLPADARLLLLVDDVNAARWPAAGRQIDAIAADKLFGFLVPVLRAWVAYGARSGDAMAALSPASLDGIAGATPYLGEHRALMLLARGKLDDGLAAVRAQAGPSGGPSARLRIVAAGILQRGRRNEQALALLTGNEPPVAAARAAIAAGTKLQPRPFGAGDGLAELFLRLAADIDRQRITPLALGMARLATFVSSDNDAAWLATGSVLAGADRGTAALQALDRVGPGPYADGARVARLRVMVRQGDKQEALAVVKADAARPDATAAEWTRLGDLLTDLDRDAEAADAYARALALAEAAGAPAAERWPLLLLMGGAREQAGQWPEAQAALQKAIALAPDQPVVLNYLGYAKLERREDLPQARALIERASKLRPDDPSITDSLGWSYYLTGDVGPAIAALEKAVAGDPAQATINEHLGDAYWTAGRRYEARYAWRAALVSADEKETARLRGKIDAGLTPATRAP